VWEVFQEILKVERIAPFEDPEQRLRAVARRDFNQLKQQVKEFEAQGLGGEALYAAIEQRLLEENDEGALKMLDGYRRLEETLAAGDLDGMSPEERFEYVVEARRGAFGEETAEAIFFEKEAYTQYKLEEKAIVEDAGLTEAEKQAEIIGRRNSLQVELASRGSYVSFGDERRIELERKLGERYGESVRAMSEEERRAAILDVYRDELPPETVERVEQVLAAQAEKRSVFEAYRSESEAILNDQDLSFDEKQERLAELAAHYETGPSGTGL
jgi:lipase chaperone LimK